MYVQKKMEALTSVMSIIDQNSELISEGDYLKLCNLMKDLHKVVPKQVRVPFQPVQISPELVARRDHWNRELNRVVSELRVIRSRMRALKIRQRVTEGVRRDAIRDAAKRLGLRLQMLTLENLRANGVVIPHAHVFFKEYLDRTNAANQTLLDDLMRRHEEAQREQAEIVAEIREIDSLVS